jgi:hypothetical protein
MASSSSVRHLSYRVSALVLQNPSARCLLGLVSFHLKRFPFPSYSASDEYLRKHKDRPPGPLPQWHTPTAFAAEGMRHVGCFVADNTAHRHKLDEVLRSSSRHLLYTEAAPGYPRHRTPCTSTDQARQSFLTALLTGHHRFIVISFYHSETARVTQICYNSEGDPNTFRQSRQLDISSETMDTPDIYLLLRWMNCIPLREPRVSRSASGH